MNGDDAINKAIDYLLQLDDPVTECARIYVKIYQSAVDCISRRAGDDVIDLENNRETFDDRLGKLEKLHELNIFQFVDTPAVVDMLRTIYDALDVAGDIAGRKERLDAFRGRPVEVYCEPDEGGEGDEQGVADEEGPVDFLYDFCSVIPGKYTPEFAEFTNKVTGEILELADGYANDPENPVRKTVALKNAITEKTLEYPAYRVHRVFRNIVVPAGHSDAQ